MQRCVIDAQAVVPVRPRLLGVDGGGVRPVAGGAAFDKVTVALEAIVFLEARAGEEAHVLDHTLLGVGGLDRVLVEQSRVPRRLSRAEESMLGTRIVIGLGLLYEALKAVRAVVFEDLFLGFLQGSSQT